MPENTFAPLTWDGDSERLYETGVKNCALYIKESDGSYPKGVAWNGITAITESPSGADPEKLYADDIVYLELRGNEEFGGTIEAYTYPDEFAVCDGSALLDDDVPGVYVGQQNRKAFGLAYKTTLGNDTEGNDYGYKLLLVYGATASPSEKAHNSIAETPEAATFSWEFSTVPVEIPGNRKKSATLELRSDQVSTEAMTRLENVLFGSSEAEARLPLPSEVVTILKGLDTTSQTPGETTGP